MATLTELQTEIKQWSTAIERHKQRVAELEGKRNKLAPGGGLLFRDMSKHEELGQEIRRENAKIESAQRELVRLRDAVQECRRQAAELERARDIYAAQLEPGGIDWSRVDPAVDQHAHMAELRTKLGRVTADLEAMYA